MSGHAPFVFVTRTIWILPENHPPNGYSLRQKDRIIRPMVIPIGGKIEPSARWLFRSAERSNHPPDGYSFSPERSIACRFLSAGRLKDKPHVDLFQAKHRRIRRIRMNVAEIPAASSNGRSGSTR